MSQWLEMSREELGRRLGVPDGMKVLSVVIRGDAVRVITGPDDQVLTAAKEAARTVKDLKHRIIREQRELGPEALLDGRVDRYSKAIEAAGRASGAMQGVVAEMMGQVRT
ncbi:MAG: hypothetical protein JWM19_949 [Actinomycetia bacterium]|nr:hypothetical protein [Actinomycetes bacterium]